MAGRTLRAVFCVHPVCRSAKCKSRRFIEGIGASMSPSFPCKSPSGSGIQCPFRSTLPAVHRSFSCIGGLRLAVIWIRQLRAWTWNQGGLTIVESAMFALNSGSFLWLSPLISRLTRCWTPGPNFLFRNRTLLLNAAREYCRSRMSRSSPQRMIGMIYDQPSTESRVDQGDIIDDCPLAYVENYRSARSGEIDWA